MVRIIFVLLVIIVTFYFTITAEVKPSLETYGKAQARLVAESIASTIDAISNVEGGSIEIDFDLEWDISVKNGRLDIAPFGDYGYSVIVSHDKFKGEKNILTNVEEIELKGVSGVLIEKDMDSVKITGR
jgi:hypothetical protein